MDQTINIDVSVYYYWYDHLVLRHNGDAEKVEAAINNKDFDTFMKFYNKYNSKDILYFPNMASLWYNNDIIGYIDITNPIGFNLITDQEYECG